MVTCSVAGTLSFTTSGTNFIRTAATPPQWKTLGYITNVLAANPTIDFYYLDGHVNAGLNNRLFHRYFPFFCSNPCLAIPAVGVTGPLSTNLNQVVVTGVSASATNVFVYQNSGAGMGADRLQNHRCHRGQIPSPWRAGQKALKWRPPKNQRSRRLHPHQRPLRGYGANPSIRIALSIRETPSSGPVGSPEILPIPTSISLNATAVASGAPVNADVVYPSNGWQTVTFLRGPNEVVGDSANAVGALVNNTGYAANDTVSINVYAYRVLANGVTIFSATPAQSSDVTSNDVFTVNWTWNTVSRPKGYRVLRSLNFAGYTEYQDVAVNSLNDLNASWTAGSTVTPTNSQAGRSVKWNAMTSDPYPVGTTNQFGQWGIVEAFGFAINNLDITGRSTFTLLTSRMAQRCSRPLKQPGQNC